ncbi:DUF5683 domain-containing protein [Pleomorphovibrio marinus]|uniref:DUF5683 domain-containing protein n=1 Tax=Pleomorphovibrio marinus TaxID=2164132 RepID=UPI001E2F60F9|nr:DUF5683 domain-containing protein [Pleomorphovibrio marinus]
MEVVPFRLRSPHWFRVVFIILLLLTGQKTFSQVEPDTTIVEQQVPEEEEELSDEERIPGYKDPNKALLFSLLVPGGGQVYNEKVWKVPLIYGGILTSIYFLEFNNRRYKRFIDALDIIRDPSSPPEANPFPNLNQDGIIRNVNFWRRNRDTMYLVFAGIYALGIVDAFVDAHLSGFDISDDLTLKFEPSVEPLMANTSSIGIALKLKF